MVVKDSLLERVFFVLLWVLVVASIFFAVMSVVEARLIINGQVYNANDSLQFQLNVFNVSLANEINARMLNDSYLLSLINNLNSSANLSNYYNMSQIDAFFSNLSDDDSAYALDSLVLHNVGNQSLNGSLSVSDTGFFAYVGSSISRVTVGWFDWLFVNNLNATNITSTNIVAINLSGALNASDVVNAFWLPVYDQRYNDTVYIDLRLLQYYNISQIDAFLDGKLNVSDQRYNDTLLILSVNSSLSNYLLLTDQRFNDTGFIVSLLSNYYNVSETDFLLDNKLNVSDQRFNDTLFILDSLMDYYNKSEVDAFLSNYALNSSVLHNSGDQILWGNLLINGNLSVIGSVMNLTVENQLINGSIIPQISGLFDLGSLSYFWDNVYAIYLHGALNASDVQNSYWLNVSDQRFNDTAYIDLRLLGFYNKSEIDGFFTNFYNKSEVDDLIAGVNVTTYVNITNNITQNITYFIENNITNNITQNITIYINETFNDSDLLPAGAYLYNDSQSFYVNESMLNLTINNISGVRVVSYNLTCTAVAGTCSVISGINISYEITEVKVTPSTITNNYKFQLTEYPLTTNIIDKDRATHVGVWDIEKSYAINGQVQANITNANINELFTIQIIYLTNGVQ